MPTLSYVSLNKMRLTNDETQRMRTKWCIDTFLRVNIAHCILNCLSSMLSVLWYAVLQNNRRKPILLSKRKWRLSKKQLERKKERKKKTKRKCYQSSPHFYSIESFCSTSNEIFQNCTTLPPRNIFQEQHFKDTTYLYNVSYLKPVFVSAKIDL